jgi:hypothetical protein
MGARADDSGRIKVKFKLDAPGGEAMVRKRLQFGMSAHIDQSESGGNDDATGPISSNVAYIKVQSPSFSDTFPVAFIDTDGSKKGDVGKPSVVKQSHNFRIVSNLTYVSAADNFGMMTQFAVSNGAFSNLGASCMRAFRQGTTPEGGEVRSQVTIKRNELGLSHPVGVVFTGDRFDGSGPAPLVTFAPDSPHVRALMEAPALRRWLISEVRADAQIRSQVSAMGTGRLNILSRGTLGLKN